MSERQKASAFRRELRQYYPEMVIQTHIDARNTGKKPYDSYVLRYGEFIAIEFKEIKGLSVRGDCVTSNQIDSLMQVSDEFNSGVSLVVCFFQNKPYNTLLMVCPIVKWLELFGFEKEGVLWHPKETSIKVSQLLTSDKGCMFINRIKQKGPKGAEFYGWDFETFFGSRYAGTE